MSPATHAKYHHAATLDSEVDLLAGLWQEAPFARLPADAPPELHDQVVDLDDPRRVYAIHCASRRHGFQELVSKFVHQLREGCGNPGCAVSTCFTVRKRLVGKAPIRRYSPLSARTLAVYLASQENPESALCADLQLPKEAPQTILTNLVLSVTRIDPVVPPEKCRHNGKREDPGSMRKATSDARKRDSTSHQPKPTPRSSPSSPRRRRNSTEGSGSSDEASKYAYGIHEEPSNKDHRSFAANLFGTVAFRMLEWLTPQGMNAIAEKLSGGDENRGKTQEPVLGPDTGLSGSSSSTPDTDAPIDLPSPSKSLLNGEPPEKLAPPEPLHLSPRDPTKSRGSPQTTFRSPQSAKPRRRASLEPPSPAKTDEPRSPTKSPRPHGFYPEKLGRTLRSSSANMTRAIPEIPMTPAFFGNITSQPSTISETDSGIGSYGEESFVSPGIAKIDLQPASPTKRMSPPMVEDPEEPVDITCPLPQTLKKIDVDVIDFICDVFEKDRTGESYLGNESLSEEKIPDPVQKRLPLKRSRRAQTSISRRQWKAFNEQTLFSVLSSPQSLISSFTADEDLFDSGTLYYSMLRLTRVAPALVFSSLWMAADSLFVPPKALQQVGLGGKPKVPREALSEIEAGAILSICFHALAASVPICPDTYALRAMAWIRGSGLTLTTFPDAMDQPISLRQRYDDAFSNELAIRLARRLCCALIARRRFAAMMDNQVSDGQPHDGVDRDVIDGLLNQVDVLGVEARQVVEFSDLSRAQHQSRMQILVLEWAKAVLLDTWDGKPFFSLASPFGGAVVFMESMYCQGDAMDLVDRDYQIEFFSERLDSMDVAIAWLRNDSTRQRRHLLDYPFIFSSNTRVSFFRAINFSRMSRRYEESSSLKSRMDAIVDRNSLITNPHHKMVLQDSLKKAASKYLILEISRKHVLRDAFDQLWRREERELLRPLKVHLGEEGGEEGFDSGGVQQEFFRMAIAEFLDPHHGAFVVDDRTRMAWFTPSSVVELWKYELLGLLTSLAVYNGLTLPVTFPRALYRKLLDLPVTDLEHIGDGWPDLASGLTMLQEWDEKNGAVEDVFARTYEYSVSTFGRPVTRDMEADFQWPQFAEEGTASPSKGEEPALVTKENRGQYITDYIRFLTDVSVRPQYAAFERGFRTCFVPKSLNLLSPSILQSLVEGVQEIDISELRKYARYVGWGASHRTIRDFWSIVKRYDDSMKRRLMEFVTASDRIPVGGMRNLQFVIQKNGEEDEGGHLPTAYTCYGTLLLPEYKDKEVLRERLAMALNNAQGFGFA